MRYAAVDFLRERYPLSILCDVLLVSTSGYREWRAVPLHPVSSLMNAW